jgi:Acyltransferase family
MAAMGDVRHKCCSYRPEINGLRAIAAVPVVLYHAHIGSPGGFVGVDVFFVISGYLITSWLAKDLEDGRIDLLAFWERRIRRILPALVAVTVATLAAGWLLLLPIDYAELAQSVFFQTLLCFNFFFWTHTNYFDGAADLKPLLHPWFLSVEEQFYLLYPFALILLTKVRRQFAFVALNLALTMARANVHVLLVDGDLRRGGLHRSLQCDSEPGFSDLLAGQVSLKDVLCATPDVEFIARGKILPNSGELFLSPAMDRFVREVYSLYDYILFDSSPIMADDAPSLAPKMDATLFVVRFAHSSCGGSLKAIDLLRDRQTNVVGIICNDVRQMTRNIITTSIRSTTVRQPARRRGARAWAEN